LCAQLAYANRLHLNVRLSVFQWPGSLNPMSRDRHNRADRIKTAVAAVYNFGPLLRWLAELLRALTHMLAVSASQSDIARKINSMASCIRIKALPCRPDFRAAFRRTPPCAFLTDFVQLLSR
jgi:hypothetical protein